MLLQLIPIWFVCTVEVNTDIWFACTVEVNTGMVRMLLQLKLIPV